MKRGGKASAERRIVVGHRLSHWREKGGEGRERSAGRGAQGSGC